MNFPNDKWREVECWKRGVSLNSGGEENVGSTFIMNLSRAKNKEGAGEKIRTGAFLEVSKKANPTLMRGEGLWGVGA